jgi:formylglycine-generating enzyme required for sulfatase activity
MDPSKQVRRVSVDHDAEVLVPAGPFLFGGAREVRYLPPFVIDRYPVSVARYSRFLWEAGYPLPPGWGDADGPPDRRDHPVTNVSYFDARTFARWFGRELPTEEQWEKAARGTDDRRYPWGNRFNMRNLNSRVSRKRGTTPIDAYPSGASTFGVVDLAGNVWEWTDSWFDRASDLKVLKGGCHALTKEHAVISVRHFNDPSFSNNLTGFRTVRRL